MKLRGPFRSERARDGLPPDTVAKASADQAMEHMRARRWAEAALTWRRLLKDNSPPALWMQFGHALKELGHFRAADRAYQKAFTSEDLDWLLQMGHFRKSVGTFGEAIKFYQMALDRCETTEQAAEIRSFLPPLKRINEARPSVLDVGLFISCVAPLPSSNSSSPAEGSLGRIHYSYGFAARGFARAADELGLDWQLLAKPQYTSDVRTITTAPKPIHLAFYPPSEARLLKGAYNVLCFAWEFSRLKTPAEVTDAHAFADARKMLNLFDEIWTPSRYAADVLSKEVSTPVFYVPSPIINSSAREQAGKQQTERRRSSPPMRLSQVEWSPLATFPRLQDHFNREAKARWRSTVEIFEGVGDAKPSKVYLSVFNPFDLRKQIRPLVEGFQKYLEREPNALLLLKTSSPEDTNETINARLLSHQLSDERELALNEVSERIWITNSSLSEREMADLYQCVSFYICTSSAEGQNLPLLEAMSWGVVPVTVNHTAMADYIDDSNAVIIESRLEPAESEDGRHLPDV